MNKRNAGIPSSQCRLLTGTHKVTTYSFDIRRFMTNSTNKNLCFSDSDSARFTLPSLL